MCDSAPSHRVLNPALANALSAKLARLNNPGRSGRQDDMTLRDDHSHRTHDHHCNCDEDSRISTATECNAAERVRRVAKAVSKRMVTMQTRAAGLSSFLLRETCCEAVKLHPLPPLFISGLLQY